MSQDTVISVRELNIDQLGAAASWQNTTLVYTHGYGIVAAKGNDRTADGDPVFLERGIPATGLPVRPGGLRAARVLRRALADVLDRRRARGRPTRSSSTTRRAPTARARRKTTFEGDGGPSSAASSTA